MMSSAILCANSLQASAYSNIAISHRVRLPEGVAIVCDSKDIVVLRVDGCKPGVLRLSSSSLLEVELENCRVDELYLSCAFRVRLECRRAIIGKLSIAKSVNIQIGLKESSVEVGSVGACDGCELELGRGMSLNGLEFDRLSNISLQYDNKRIQSKKCVRLLRDLGAVAKLERVKKGSKRGRGNHGKTRPMTSDQIDQDKDALV